MTTGASHRLITIRGSKSVTLPHPTRSGFSLMLIIAFRVQKRFDRLKSF